MEKALKDWTLAEVKAHCKSWYRESDPDSCETCKMGGWCCCPPDEWDLRSVPDVTADEKAFLRVLLKTVDNAVIGRTAGGLLYWDNVQHEMDRENLLPFKSFNGVKTNWEFQVKDFFDEEELNGILA